MERHRPSLRRLRRERARRKAAAARFIRLISDRSRDALAQRVPEADRSKLRVVHLGVDLPAAAAPQPRAGALRVLCAANLVPVKGHDALIAAMAAAVERGVDVTCDLAGDGPERERIGAAIARRGLGGRVALLGHVPHERLLASLRAGDYDAVALASTERGTEFEGIPVFLMEAMAAGVPCVATRTGAIPELVADGCGILVDQGDPQALADALERLWRDPPLRGSLAEAARARVAAEFDTRRTTAQLADLMAASAPPERARSPAAGARRRLRPPCGPGILRECSVTPPAPPSWSLPRSLRRSWRSACRSRSR